MIISCRHEPIHMHRLKPSWHLLLQWRAASELCLGCLASMNINTDVRINGVALS